jgi:hypothetical protein
MTDGVDDANVDGDIGNCNDDNSENAGEEYDNEGGDDDFDGSEEDRILTTLVTMPTVCAPILIVVISLLGLLFAGRVGNDSCGTT